jgi:hypothetical protein
MKKLLTIGLFCTAAHAFAQLSPVYDSIPMRDGKKLAMTLYQPSGCSSCPTILVQTPYNRLLYNFGLPLNVGINIDAFSYNMVVVDWRGFYGSNAAAYSGSPTQSQDGYDAVEWIAAQSWCNGKVGTWGPSALGKVQFQTAKGNPPHLVCMVPLVAAPQFPYVEYYPGGSLRTEYVEQLDVLGFGTGPVIVANPVHNFVWSYAENLNTYPDSIRVPTFMIGGWYDHNIPNMLEFFNAIRATSTGVQNEHRLLMGPWVHGGHGTASVGSSTQGQLSYPNAADWNDSLALMFFDYHMRGIANGWNTTPFVQYYQMGENQWKTSAVWPPSGMSNIDLYMHQDGSLTSGMPTGTTAGLSYHYDPQDPSPTIGGCTLRSDLEQGPYDQAPDVESRNDVLIFTSPVLGQDVVMKGQAVAHLKISSDKKDTDFAIRLTDVYPDGRSMLLNDGIMRARFRNGYAAADTMHMTTGTIYDIDVELPATCNTFLAGHRIRVDVSSANYPKYNRNDNSSGVMYPGNSMDSLANPQIANNTVYLNASHASYITMPLVDFAGYIGEQATNIYSTTLYPNPSAGNAVLSLVLVQPENIAVSVTDLSGQMVWNEQRNFVGGSHSFTLNRNGISQGIYLVNIRGQQGSQTLKWVVE